MSVYSYLYLRNDLGYDFGSLLVQYVGARFHITSGSPNVSGMLTVGLENMGVGVKMIE